MLSNKEYGSIFWWHLVSLKPAGPGSSANLHAHKWSQVSLFLEQSLANSFISILIDPLDCPVFLLGFVNFELCQIRWHRGVY